MTLHFARARLVPTGTAPVLGRGLISDWTQISFDPDTALRIVDSFGAGSPRLLDTGAVHFVSPNPGEESKITKTLRIDASEFVPSNGSATWQFSTTGLHPTAFATDTDYFAPVLLSKGIVLRTLRVRGNKGQTADKVSVALVQSTDGNPPVITTLSTSSLTVTSWSQADSTVSQLIGNENYLLLATLRDDASPLNLDLKFCEIDYTIPDYNKAV